MFFVPPGTFRSSSFTHQGVNRCKLPGMNDRRLTGSVLHAANNNRSLTGQKAMFSAKITRYWYQYISDAFSTDRSIKSIGSLLEHPTQM